jgi:hypothetical protein
VAFLEAGNKTANIHLDLSKTLINYPAFKIKDWLKRKYQKHFINFKQTKEFEENFEEAQNSWLDLNEKMKKSKKEYCDAIATRKNCEETAKSAESNPKYTVEQRAKLQQRTEKAKEDQLK